MTTTTPEALAWSTDNCPVVEAARLIGDRSTLIVLRELLLGVRRFSDIQDHAGLPKQVLSDRLALLVDHGLVRKVPYREEGQRERYEYRLTDAGLELYPAILALADWGRRHLLDSPTTPPSSSCTATAAARWSCRWPASTTTSCSHRARSSADPARGLAGAPDSDRSRRAGPYS